MNYYKLLLMNCLLSIIINEIYIIVKELFIINCY